MSTLPTERSVEAMSKFPDEIVLEILRWLPDIHFYNLPLCTHDIKTRRRVRRDFETAWQHFQRLIWALKRHHRMTNVVIEVLRKEVSKVQRMRATWEARDSHWTVQLRGQRAPSLTDPSKTVFVYTNGRPIKGTPVMCDANKNSFYPLAHAFAQLIDMDNIEAIWRAHHDSSIRVYMLKQADRFIDLARAHNIIE